MTNLTTTRRVAYAALILVYTHAVFGAIVRISGSGLGCGNHWPDCNNQLWPTLHDPRTIIEFTHRLLASALILTIIALVWLARTDTRPKSVRPPALLALAIAISAALIGALIVKLDLSNPYWIVVHNGIAMLLLATLVVAVARAGGLGAATLVPGDATPKTYRAARIAAIMAFIVVEFGALTANIPGAAQSCQGFPWCHNTLLQGAPLHTQLTHRVLAFLLFFHLFALAYLVRKRREAPRIVLAARLAFFAVVLQICVAATLVELHLPAPLQSLHQAVGTLIFIATMILATLAKRASAEPLAAHAPATLAPAL
jgi:heme a synthase